MPIPVAARSVVWAFGRSLAGIAGSNPAGGVDVCVVCCRKEQIRTIKTNKQYGKITKRE